MAKPVFKIEKKNSFLVVEFQIPGGVTTPPEAAEAVAELGGRLAGDHILLISGRGPVWLFGMLLHAGHPAQAAGTYDPRVGGYVIVASHVPGVKVGEVIKLEDE